MTLEELRLIKDFIYDSKYDARIPEFNRVMFILNREIKLKELDPRKESSK